MDENLLKLIANTYEFISRLKIIDKDGKLVTLDINSEQYKILEALLTEEDCLFLKARQIGSSTIVAAYLFWIQYISAEPITIAILSHKLASSKHLLEMHKTFYHNLPDFLKRPVKETATELKYLDTGAGIVAVSAEGKGGMRSFTCSYLQISEYAFAPNPDELKATALSALNNGQLVIESTANFFNDALHQEVLKAEKGEAKWNYSFFAWFDHEEYSLEIPEDEVIEWTPQELELQRKHSLTNEQLYWRREKESKLGRDKFKREFPANIEDAYSITGNTYLTSDDFGVDVIRIEPREWNIFEEPDSDDQYAIGVDVSAGVGRDWSVIYILSKKTNQMVATWRSNETSPVVLADRIINKAIEYNNALVLVESNNVGAVTLNELNHMGYYKIWKTPEGKDWLTTLKSKTQMFENLKTKIQQGHVRILDNILYAELRAITVNDKGNIELSDNGDAHSDNAVAFALANMCLNKVTLKKIEFLPEWIKSKNARKIINKGGVSVASNRRY